MNTLVGIGKYIKEDYEEILKISSDRDNLDATWEEWKINQENVKKQIKLSGFKVIDIIVKPRELVSYCREKGMEINGQSRSNFISYKTGLLNK